MSKSVNTSLINFTIKDLFSIGAHFGHKVSNWHPGMMPYIYGIKNDMHIIDLRKTYFLLSEALNFLFKSVKNNSKVLFVGTRPETSEIVSQCTQSCNQFYINYRWLGGTLTNWRVISKAIDKLASLERFSSSTTFHSSYTKKERLYIEKEINQLRMNFGGITKLSKTPDVIIVLDAKKDRTAILEANKMKIPVISLLDTDCDPQGIDYPIPSNDDSIKCLQLYIQTFASCILLANQFNSGRAQEHLIKQKTAA